MTDPSPPNDRAQPPVAIEEEMQRSYLDYAMSVIVSRAIPDVRDGLKPVHRRILYAMKEGGYDAGRPYRKSARVVGDVMGNYHPHGDQAIYDAMVRMAQDFSMRLPLIDGQGNFGSMDGDPPAAMRYTEARLARAASAVLEDIDKETVDFQPNYDERAQEPVVLPARFPNLLVNGAGGIAVGMATNIPPHNLGEVIDACCALLDAPDIGLEDLLQILPGPDFPTGGVILGRSGILQAYATGRGSVVLRARTHMETVRSGRQAIIVTEVPYQVNKARMLENMAELVRDKRVEGIADLRDESDKSGVRVVIEVKRDHEPDVVLNQLYRFSQLQISFGVNMLALNGMRPETLTLKGVLQAFLQFREEVITRRTIHDLDKARARAHVLIGLAIAVANIDDVIALIRQAPDPETARSGLMARAWPADDVRPLVELIDEPDRKVVDGHYHLSETQARAILDLRLHRLTGLEREKIAGELQEIGDRIKDFLEILGSRDRLLTVLREELMDIRARYADPRRTTLEDAEFEQDVEALIRREDMVVTVTNGGYIKRVPLSTYRAQRRGGRGRTGMSTRDEDFVSQVFVLNTHTPVLFFSSTGQVYKLKVYRLPQGTPQSRGKAMVNLLPLAADETISTIMPLPEDESTWGDSHVIFATASGNVRRNSLSDFTNVKANGKIAMKLDGDDRLVAVRICTEDDDVLLATHGGKCLRFAVNDVRVFSGRTSTGVRGIRLGKGDRVIGLSILQQVAVEMEQRDAYLRLAAAQRRAGEEDGTAALPVTLATEEVEALAAREQFILTVTENGFGKRSSAYEYRQAGRGGQGIANIETSERNGPVVSSFPVADGDEVMMVTDGGQLIRMPVGDIRIAARKTQGVTLFRITPGERVVSVAHLGDLTGDDADGDTEDGTALPADEGGSLPEDQ